MELNELNKHKDDASLISEELLQLVSFNIGEEDFGIEILAVQEIIRMVEFTRVPNSPEFVKGVINLRGKVIPIIDLRLRLGMPNKEASRDTRIIVVEIKGRVVGFIVDKVNEVIRIDKKITEPPPQMVSGVGAEYIVAIAKLESKMLIMLDLNTILANTEDIIGE